ncbi:MAG: hypothetical protein OXF24_08035 [Hyphomicrobiales bacterium]|nr:hypothetical protein [Hyphomicrobiales bacterium]MCY4049521.1 hypothetical protein [Hyphomicrobiales bacterium]MCY4052492.1 hypothetical protein [Hyphomicrobiales bacterium]
MKTILTTIFAIAVMVFAFNANPAYATEESNKAVEKEVHSWFCKDGRRYDIKNSKCEGFVQKMDELRDPDQAGNERDVADSGNEGPSSAAQESDQ